MRKVNEIDLRRWYRDAPGDCFDKSMYLLGQYCGCKPGGFTSIVWPTLFYITSLGKRHHTTVVSDIVNLKYHQFKPAANADEATKIKAVISVLQALGTALRADLAEYELPINAAGQLALTVRVIRLANKIEFIENDFENVIPNVDPSLEGKVKVAVKAAGSAMVAGVHALGAAIVSVAEQLDQKVPGFAPSPVQNGFESESDSDEPPRTSKTKLSNSSV